MPVKWLMIGLTAMLWSTLAAAENQSMPSHVDLEFLEFLGSWETHDGEWINPMDLIDQSSEEEEKKPSSYGRDVDLEVTEQDLLRKAAEEATDSDQLPHSGQSTHD